MALEVALGADIQNLLNGFSQASKALEGFGQKAKSIGQDLSLYISAPLALISKQALQNAGDLESLTLGLKSVEEQQFGVAKSAEYAISRLEEYKEVAKLPGLGLKEVVSASINLRSVGFSAGEAKKAILSFGNALALVGKGKTELSGVNAQLTQLAGKTSGFGADLRIIREYAPQVGGALQRAFGTIDTEKIAKTGVTGKEVIAKIIQELDKLPKAVGGLKNSFENLSDATFNSLADIGLQLNKTFDIQGKIEQFSEFVIKLADSFKNLSPFAQKAIGVLVGLGVTIPPLLISVGLLIPVFSTMSSGFLLLSGYVIKLSSVIVTTLIPAIRGILLTMSPMSIALTAVVGGLALFAMFSGNASKKVDELSISQKSFNEVQSQSISSSEVEIAKLNALLVVAQSSIRTLDEKKDAIKRINEISPKYLGGITLENLKTIDTTKAVKEYTKALIENASIKGSESKLTQLSAKLQEEQDVYDNATQEYFKTVKDLQAQGVPVAKYVPRTGFLGKLATEANEAKERVNGTRKAIQDLAKSIAGKTVDLMGVVEIPTNLGVPELSDEELAKLKKFNEKSNELFQKADILRQENYANSLKNELQKSVALEEAKYKEKINSVNKEVASEKSKQAMLQQLEIEHQNELKKIRDSYKSMDTITPKGVKLGGIGSTLANGLDAFGKVGAVDNNKGLIAGLVDKINAGIPSLLEAFSKVGYHVQTETEKLRQRTLNGFMKFNSSLTEPMIGVLTNLNEQLNQILRQGAVDALQGIGDIAGKMITGSASLADAGNMILGVIGTVFSQMGQQFLSAGIALSGLSALLTNPFTSAGALIAVGLALTALGGALSSTVSGGGKGSSSGYGGSSSYSNNNSNTGYSGSQALELTINLNGQFTQRGNSLVSAINQTQKQKLRTR